MPCQLTARNYFKRSNTSRAWKVRGRAANRGGEISNTEGLEKRFTEGTRKTGERDEQGRAMQDCRGATNKQAKNSWEDRTEHLN